MIDPVASSLATLQNLRSPERANPVSTPQIRIGELPGATDAGSVRGPAGASFQELVGGLVRSVDAKSKVADAEVRSLMLGESDNIHRSMIAMQESGLAFNLLVEVRNKLVESYQELMRMPV